MGTFQAIADESESYLEENVDIEIVDVEFATGEALNVEETATFKVKVTNRGLLNMDDVIVRVSGQNGALVKSPNAAAEFTDEFDIGTFDTITGDGGGSVISRRCYEPQGTFYSTSFEGSRQGHNSSVELELGPNPKSS